MGFIKKVVGGVGKVVGNIFGLNKKESPKQPSQPQQPSRPPVRTLPYISPIRGMETSVPRSSPNPWQSGGGYGMGEESLGGFGGTTQEPMTASYSMHSPYQGGQSFYGGASNNMLDRMRRGGIMSPSPIAMGMGFKRNPFGM